MFRKSLLIVFILTAVLSISVLAQEEKSDKDTLSTSDEDNSEYCDTQDFDFGRFDMMGKPTIEATYGVSKIGLKSLFGNFANTGSAEIRLSNSSLREFEGIVSHYKNNYVFISNNSMDLTSGTTKATDFTSEAWRFGVGWQRAYAYQIGRTAIIPYTSNAFVWTRLSYSVKGTLTPTVLPDGSVISDADRLDPFNETFRFGQMTEGGIKLQIVPLLTLNAGYERAIVFPRHLFWKHAGSLVVEGIGLGALDAFVREVMDSSPAAGPIVNFVLKNAFSYGLYELRKGKMNWPFDTAEPLTFDTWKVGMTFTF